MRKLTLILALLLLLVFRTAHSQNLASNTLLQHLSLVPDIQDARGMLSYVDYREMEANRGVNKPTLDDFTNKTEIGRLWFTLISGTTFSGFWRTYHNPQGDPYQLAQLMFDTFGFSFLDIDKAFFLGDFKDSSQQTLILEGNFSQQKVNGSLSKLGFVSQTINDSTLWCKTANCASPTELNEIDFSNPSTGLDHVLVSSNLIVVSSDVDLARAIGVSSNGTLADVPEYRAAAEAANRSGPVIQMQFFNPKSIGEFDVQKVWAKKSIINDAARLKRYIEDFGVLPTYSLAALAQTGSADTETTLLLLTYQTQSEADTAAKLLEYRIEHYFSEYYARPMSDILAERGVKDYSAQVEFDKATGLYIVLLPFVSPKSSNQAYNDGAGHESGMVYRAWMSEFWKGSPILATEFILPSS